MYFGEIVLKCRELKVYDKAESTRFFLSFNDKVMWGKCRGEMTWGNEVEPSTAIGHSK